MLFSTILVLISTVSTAVATGSPCSSIPYKELLFLSKFPAAETYCSAHYPIPTMTVTTTFTAPARKARRVPEAGPTPHAQLGERDNGAQWASILKIGGSFVKTLCTCIETTPVVTATSTTTLCAYPSHTIAPAPCSTVTGDNGQGDTVLYSVQFGSYQGTTLALDGSAFNSLDGTLSACDASQQCANKAAGVDANGFIVTFYTNVNQWRCQFTTSERPFDATDCSIKYAYGFYRP